MTKVTIEVDLPIGVSKAEAEGAVQRAFDPNWVADWWHIDDIIEQDNGAEDEPYSDLTEDEAREVLRLMIKEHDWNMREMTYPVNTPVSLESFLYRKIFKRRIFKISSWK